MTTEQAKQILEKGCRHNPWSGDVCGNCAKDVLEVLVNAGDAGAGCRTCGSAHHTTSDHAWLTFNEEGRDG